jgi:Leucine-rich repeat (LRR) protein
LDVSGCTSLTTLDCSRMTNKALTSLSLGSITTLTSLRCMENSLTSLDVSNCAGLTTLRAEKNKLLALKINSNVSNITDTEYLNISGQSDTLTLYYNSGNWYMALSTDIEKDSINSITISGDSDSLTIDKTQGKSNQLYISLTDDQIEEFSDGSATVEYNYATGNSNYTLSASLTTTLSSDDNVIINETNFPDSIFRKFIATKLNKSVGDTLNIIERLGLTELSVSDTNYGITDATGIALFPNLTRLSLAYNKLTSLDVSSNTKLTYLDCGRNTSLTSLNLGDLTGITTLRCMEDSLTSLDVSKLNSLTILRAEKNNLTALDLSNNTKVGTTSDGSNIDSQTYPTRTLKYDADKNEYYVTLPSYIESNVNSITFTLNEKSYSCTAEEDGDSIKLIIPLTDDAANALSGKSKTLSYNYPTGSTSGNLTTMSVSMTVIYPSTDIVELTSANFPDAKIFATLKEYDADGDGWLSNTEIVTIDSLDISNEGSNVNLKGLSHLTYLRYLNCSNDSLASVSLGDSIKSNIYLEKLICQNSRLKALDVSANTNLVTLDCDSNAIATLSLPTKELAELHCEYNQLTSFDSIKTVTTLLYLYCGHNNLTEDSTNFSKLTSLIGLTCDSTNIQTLTLPNTTTLTYLNCSDNNIATLDLNNSTGLTGLNCNNNLLTSLDVTACTSLDTLLVRDNKLTSIDLSKCESLDVLQLTTNLLTSLDLSNNTALKELTVSANQLDTLDLSNCTNLETVHCSDNKIASLNLGEGSAYKDLTFSGNKVTTIDLSHCTSLEILECQDNSLTSLTLPESDNLDSIDAHGQRLQAKLYANGSDVYVVFPAGFDSTKVSDSYIKGDAATFTVTQEDDGDCDVTVQSGLSGRVSFYDLEDGDTTGENWQSIRLTYNYKYKDNDGDENDSLMDVRVDVCAYSLTTNSKYNYASICLPFPYEIAEDTKAYTITSKGDEDSDGYTQLVLKQVTGVVPAKTPLIVRSGDGTDGAGNRIVFNMDTVTTQTEVTNPYLTGTLVDYYPSGTTVYTMGAGTSSGKYGFWKFTGTKVQANSVYITAENMENLIGTTSSSKGFVFIFEDDDTSTGIETITNESTADSETDDSLWYTIQGVALPGKPTAPGLYIHNGHKVIIR